MAMLPQLLMPQSANNKLELTFSCCSVECADSFTEGTWAPPYHIQIVVVSSFHFTSCQIGSLSLWPRII